MRRLTSSRSLLLLALLLGCSGGRDEELDREVELAAPEIAVAEILGHWSGDWGQMVLQQVGSEVHGSYVHDQGTIVGTFDGSLFVGWWSEVPSRQPTRDAGEVEFRFRRLEDGKLALDGRWRYGVEGTWREDWDLSPDEKPPNPALLTRFEEPSAFLRHP